MVKRCAVMLAAGVVVAALSSTPPARATAAWVAASASPPSANKFLFSPGSTSDEAQQNVMCGCRSEGHPDCTFAISGQQCVGAAVMAGQVFGGVGLTNFTAVQDPMQQRRSATGWTQGESNSACATDY
jgi:hypothetical protein